MKNDLRWMKLDNAAKIYPAARRRYWTNVFRLAVTYKDPVDPVVLKEALGRVIKRFPSVAARLRTGFFSCIADIIKLVKASSSAIVTCSLCRRCNISSSLLIT